MSEQYLVVANFINYPDALQSPVAGIMFRTGCYLCYSSKLEPDVQNINLVPVIPNRNSG